MHAQRSVQRLAFLDMPRINFFEMFIFFCLLFPIAESTYKNTEYTHFCGSLPITDPPKAGIIKDCEDALSLVPLPDVVPSPGLMKAHHTLAKPFTLTLVQKEKIVGKGKIRLPAGFIAGDCFIYVLGHATSQAPPELGIADVLHFGIWRAVINGVTKGIEKCLIEKSRFFHGLKTVDSYGSQWTATILYTVVWTPKNFTSAAQANPWLAKTNLYTATGQINDNRWPTPFVQPEHVIPYDENRGPTQLTRPNYKHKD